MNISRLFVLRPVATSLLMIALVMVGLVAMKFLPVSSLPNVDYPTIQVQTFYPGASPSVMATTVEFTVPQNSLSQVLQRFNSGTKLPVTLFNSDNSKQLAAGTLYAISNQMATSTGTVTLRATFPNDDESLYPNEFVNAQLLVDTMQNAILVPTPAVQTGAPGEFVYLVNSDDSVTVQKVTTGPSDGKNTVILSGVTVGQTVVTDGMDRLSDGAKVKLAGAKPAESSSAPASASSSAASHQGRKHKKGSNSDSSAS